VSCAVAVVAGAALAFLAGAPYTLLDLPAFLNMFGALSHMYAVGTPPAEPAWLIYLKHLRINLGWIGVVMAGVALVVAVGRAWTAPVQARLTWATAAIFAVLGYWLISGQRLIWARYLLPILPALAILTGGTIAWIAGRFTSASAPLARRAAIASALLVLVIAQPAAQAIGWTRLNAKTSTAELAYQWIVEHVPARAKVAVETRNLLLPPGAFESTNFVRLIEADLDRFRAEGYQYIVASSRTFGEALNAPTPDERTLAYRTLFDRLELLRTISPTDEHPGDEWRVYRVPPG
jgi:hypothetical protein